MSPSVRDWRGAARAQRDKLARTSAYRSALSRLTPATLAVNPDVRADKRFKNVPIAADVLVYFHDNAERSYQLEQWLPVLERLYPERRLLVVTRVLSAFQRLSALTSLPIVYVRWLHDLDELLVQTDPKLVLYVNNAAGNFQVLSWRRALHVHIGHGESDKVSMSSNQVKAYDVAMVAGQAAERRYEEALLAFTGENLVRVGRPQLDLDFPRRLPPSRRSTVLYAPTWQGATGAMNYTSVPRFGPGIVRDLVAHGGFRVVYKPHPRVLTGSPAVTAGHEKIVQALRDANTHLPAADQHVVELDAQILSFFGSVDAVVTDVSSVAIDWLYLRTDGPLWICDPRDDRDALLRNSPLASRAYVLDGETMDGVAAHVEQVLADDPKLSEREEVRRLYFGDLAPGESTLRFIEAIDELLARRDALLEAKAARVSVLAETPAVSSA